MNPTVVHCTPTDEGTCQRCGAVVQAPDQVCRRDGDSDDAVTLDEPLTRRDWRILHRAAERECHRLVRRLQQSTSWSNGNDARSLERLRQIVPVLARAANDEPRFT